jgi:hypothetical protein
MKARRHGGTECTEGGVAGWAVVDAESNSLFSVISVPPW